MGPALPAFPEDGEADWRVFVRISHEALLFGLTIVKEIGIASRSATRHDGAPPAVTVICPIALRVSAPGGPVGTEQLVTTGEEHVAEADGGVGTPAAPDSLL